MNYIKKENLFNDFSSMDISSNTNTNDYPQYKDSNIFGASYGYGLYTGSIYSFHQHVGPVYPHPMPFVPLLIDYSYMSHHRLGFLKNITNQEHDHCLRNYIQKYQFSMRWTEYCTHFKSYHHHYQSGYINNTLNFLIFLMLSL